LQSVRLRSDELQIRPTRNRALSRAVPKNRDYALTPHRQYRARDHQCNQVVAGVDHP
jgi:hypothetical protein